MAHFRCPLCRQGWSFAEYRRVVAGKPCPRCGGDVGAALASKRPKGGEVRAAFAFFGAALVAALVLLGYVFGAETLEAVLVAGLGWRPIGGPQIALNATAAALGVLAGAVLMLASLIGMPHVPRFASVVVAIGLAWLPWLGLVAASRPWVRSALQHDSWPTALELVRFEVCGSRFARSGETLAARGDITLVVRNRGPRPVDEAVFTVVSGVSHGLSGPYGQHRLVVSALAPGSERRIALSGVPLGLIEFPIAIRGAPRSLGRPDGQVFWDRVLIGGARVRGTVERPAAASVGVGDCPGAQRP